MFARSVLIVCFVKFSNTRVNMNNITDTLQIYNSYITDMEEQAQSQSLVTGHVKRYTEDSNTAADLFR